MRVVVLVAVVGCAQAGAPDRNQPIDAQKGAIDAPLTVDAAKPVDAPPNDVCTTAVTCATAMDLGSISGDTDFDQKMVSGYQAGWYKVRVTEDSSSPLGIKLSFTAQLTSPSNEVYDLITYINTGSDVVECTTPNGSATVSGSAQTRQITWGEGTFSNGNDDSRTLIIEVRPKGTSCMSAGTWQLVVTGDT